MEQPTTPPPMTTASAESRIMGELHSSAMGSGPRYGPADSKVSPRFSGIRTYARLPHVADYLTGVDVAFVSIPFDPGGSYRVETRLSHESIQSTCELVRL